MTRLVLSRSKFLIFWVLLLGVQFACLLTPLGLLSIIPLNIVATLLLAGRLRGIGLPPILAITPYAVFSIYLGAIALNYLVRLSGGAGAAQAGRHLNALDDIMGYVLLAIVAATFLVGLVPGNLRGRRGSGTRFVTEEF